MATLISEKNAKQKLSYYRNLCGNQHIDINGEYHYGHIFTRLELQNMAGAESDGKGIIAMLALDGQSPSHTLSLVLAGVQSNGNVDRTGLYISNKAPYEGRIGVFTKIAKYLGKINLESFNLENIKETEFNQVAVEGGVSTMVPYKFYQGFLMYCFFAEQNPLYVDLPFNSNNKLKALNISHDELSDLELWIGNGSDYFIFVPLIKYEDHIGRQLNKHHLTFALVRINSRGEIVGSIQEYFSPCPAGCDAYDNFMT
ncbi:MAG: hypothetical protein ACI8ZM_001328 [Crocinitomix sp.]|jgi:hypothetical protein